MSKNDEAKKLRRVIQDAKSYIHLETNYLLRMRMASETLSECLKSSE
ncbi:MAG: hypothetical protein ACQCN6_13315 [Candidatus Bathyarchaeia archaeon]